jgi:hypothetical protein
MKKIIFVLTLLFLALFICNAKKNDDSESADLSVKLEKVHYLAQEQINVEYLTGKLIRSICIIAITRSTVLFSGKKMVLGPTL